MRSLEGKHFFLKTIDYLVVMHVRELLTLRGPRESAVGAHTVIL